MHIPRYVWRGGMNGNTSMSFNNKMHHCHSNSSKCLPHILFSAIRMRPSTLSMTQSMYGRSMGLTTSKAEIKLRMSAEYLKK